MSAVTKLTADSIKQPGPENTLMGKVNELVPLVNNATGNGTPSAGTFSTLDASGATTLAGAFRTSNEIVPATIAADTNDYNPTGLSAASLAFVSSDAARNVTGIVAQAGGRHLWLWNSGSFTITLKNSNVGSAAANRFVGNAGADVALAAAKGVHLVYSATISKWLILDLF